jgi:hypothetical protein
MKKILVLVCYHLGLWGFLGFVITLLIGFIVCCANLSSEFFYTALVIFAVIAALAITYCIMRKCSKEALNLFGAIETGKESEH